MLYFDTFPLPMIFTSAYYTLISYIPYISILLTFATSFADGAMGVGVSEASAAAL